MKRYIILMLCVWPMTLSVSVAYSQDSKEKNILKDQNPLSRKNNLSGVQEKLAVKEKNSSGIKEYLERAREPRLMKVALVNVKKEFLRLKKELNAAKKRRVSTKGRGKKFLSKDQKKQAISVLEKRFQRVSDDYNGLKKGETFPRVPMKFPLKIGRIGTVPIREGVGIMITGVKNEKEFSENAMMQDDLRRGGWIELVANGPIQSFMLISNIKRGKKIKRLTFSKPSTSRTVSDGILTIRLSELTVWDDVFEIIGYYRRDRKIYYLIERFERSRLERYLKNENNPMPKRNDIDGQKSNRKKGG